MQYKHKEPKETTLQMLSEHWVLFTFVNWSLKKNGIYMTGH